MADELVKKRRIRGGHKASATKIMQQISEHTTSSTPDEAKLSCLKRALNEKFATIKTLDEDISGLIEDESVVEDIEAADQFKETIFESLLSIDRLMEKLKVKDPAVSASRASTHSQTRVKLPKLHLRSFAGDLTQWTSFWESFQSAVHDNDELTDTEKFNYLNSLMERSAKEAISGFSLTAGNYHEAIKTLQRRFGSRQHIVDKHLDVLFSVEPVHTSNVRGLRRLFDTVTSHIRSLHSLKVQPTTYANTFCPKLLSKLPHELKLIVSRSLSDDQWDLDVMLTAIEKELMARERSGMTELGRQVQDDKSSTAAALISGSSAGLPPCCYCNHLHKPGSCETVIQVDARKQILKRSGRCFICLRKGHLSRECRSTGRCRLCKGRHHSSICHHSTTGPRSGKNPDRSTQTTIQPSNSGRQSSNTTVQPISVQSNPPTHATLQSTTLNPAALTFTSPPTSTSLYVDASKTVLLQTALTTAYNPRNPSVTLPLRLILDSGSQRSYLTERAQHLLGLERIKKQKLSIATFGASKSSTRCADIVHIGIVTKDGKGEILELLIVPHICQPLSAQPIDLSSKMYTHLAPLALADTHHSSTPIEIDILVGSDFYWQLTTGEVIRGEGGPVAINTKLGWVLSGPIDTGAFDSSTSTVMTVHTLHVDAVAERLDETLRSFWKLESLGVEPLKDISNSNPSHTVQMKDGRYEVSLPWREFHEPLPTNYELSLQRLKGLLRKLRHDPHTLEVYSAIIREQLNMGIIERIVQTDSPNRKHYLPHHAIVRHDKDTTKVRIVYDASAHAKGPSLNDCLYTGPKFNQKILEILLRFRSYSVAWIADIEKAFLMISMSPQDRDVLRFLWVDDPLSTNPDVVTYRFTRVVFGVSSSPYLLNSTIQHHLKQYSSSHQELVSKLLESFYVDDLVCGGSSDQEAYEHFSFAREVLSHASFNLRKFTTSSHALRERMQKEDITDPAKKSSYLCDATYADAMLCSHQCTQPEEHKVLGVRWNNQSDQLIFELSTVAEMAFSVIPTKRSVISFIGRFYDPIGFMSPVTIRFKVLMQELCKSQLTWDDPLEGATLQTWKNLTSDLMKSKPMTIERHYFAEHSQVTEYQLYGFCDASMVAYAAVIYLVAVTPSGKYSSFVVAKTRVSPLKTQTIPRLELLSALLLARLMKTVMETLATRLTLQTPRCFTDSTISLCWIKGTDKDWKPFVQNRVREIRELVPMECWDHCSGKSNPADIPSRGVSSSELAASELWQCGPSWLQEGYNSPLLLPDIPEACLKELKASSAVCLMTSTDDIIHVSSIIDCIKYSSLHKLFRVTAYVLQFIARLKGQDYSNGLTRNDLAKARVLWILECQTSLTRDNNFSMWKSQFNLYLDDQQLWRCGGRLQNSGLPIEAKHPIILARRHWITTLIVRDAHCTVKHNGVKETLTQIRSQYWIVGGRSLVRSIIHSCVICRRIDGNPFRPPPPPPLPAFRVKEAPPFCYTGVDYAGPLFVRDQRSDTSSSKVWICLFTCCVTRAVHLELVIDMSAPTFIRCVKRFAARRGLPRKFISDNGKAFKTASKLLTDMFSQPECKRYFADVGVEWTFNLEKAPWWGGIFERLVQSVKRCLRKIIGQAKFTYDELNTALIEVEGIINSRPLTCVSSDDLDEPLTPSHLLVGRRLLSLPDDLGIVDDSDDDFSVSDATLQKRARHLNNVINHFWNRWVKEYLLELRNAHRYPNTQYQSLPAARVGDIVVIHDPDLPRGFWKAAKIVKLIEGKDGHFRGAILKVAARGDQATTLQRPLQSLYPLEIHASSSDNPTDNQDHTVEHSPPPSGVSLDTERVPDDHCDEAQKGSTRRSALKAKERFKKWSAELLDDTVDHP